MHVQPGQEYHTQLVCGSLLFFPLPAFMFRAIVGVGAPVVKGVSRFSSAAAASAGLSFKLPDMPYDYGELEPFVRFHRVQRLAASRFCV